MKKDNPRFAFGGDVICGDCPFADEDGYCERDSPFYGLCNRWGRDHTPSCPTAETYAEACKLAAKESQS